MRIGFGIVRRLVDSEMPVDCPTLAVLAGGSGSRIGGPKSGLVLRGMPVLEWLSRRIAWPGRTLLVTAPSNRSPVGRESWNSEVVDPVDGAGPLQGIITALGAVKSAVIVIPVDMPLLRREQLAELGEALFSGGARGLLCRRERQGRELIEPFPCALSASVLAELEARLKRGSRSLRSLVDAGICDCFDANHWPAECWENLNSPQDLARFEASGPAI